MSPLRIRIGERRLLPRDRLPVTVARVGWSAGSGVVASMRRLLILPVLLLALGASDRPLWVGPNEAYKTLGQAVAAARAGDQIFIRAGTYRNDYAEIRAPLTIT